MKNYFVVGNWNKELNVPSPASALQKKDRNDKNKEWKIK